jgi:hypothetical protein
VSEKLPVHGGGPWMKYAGLWKAVIGAPASLSTSSSMAIKTEHTSWEAKNPGEAYLDTSAFIAFLDRFDSYHVMFKNVFATPPPLVTSALVVAEAHGWFLRRYDARRATEFLSFLDALPALTVVAFDSAELTKERPILSRF